MSLRSKPASERRAKKARECSQLYIHQSTPLSALRRCRRRRGSLLAPESVTKVVVDDGVIEVDDDVISLVRGTSDDTRKENNRKH